MWVLPVYAAREDPVPAVDATTITAHAPALQPLTAASALPGLVAAEARGGDLLLMLGAGDIVELTPEVLAALAPVAGRR